MVLNARSEFDAFLFAHIGEEKNGMLLSVLSALARLDLDPWREAAELARMPRQTAKQRLTSLIESLPNQPPMRPEPETVSTRLIALLPPPANPSVASSNKLPGGVSPLNSRAVIYIILVNLIIMGSASNRVLTGLLDRLLRGRYPAGCKQNRGCLRGRAFVF